MMLDYIIGICLIILCIICFLMWSKNQELLIEIKNLKKSGKTEELEKKAEENLKSLERLTTVKVGDKGVYTRGLQWVKTKESFNITYEVEIVEVSHIKLKIKATNFKSDNTKANDPSHRKEVMEYVENVWVEKDKVDIIIKNDIRREVNLSKILDN